MLLRIFLGEAWVAHTHQCLSRLILKLLLLLSLIYPSIYHRSDLPSGTLIPDDLGQGFSAI